MSNRPNPQNTRWEWGNLGFNTRTKLWFLELHNHSGLVESFIARNMFLKNGSGIQYHWPDSKPPFWHVRERIFAQDVKKMDYDDKGNLIIEFLPIHSIKETIPENYGYLTYAYSLTTSKGFVEFRDTNNNVIKKLSEKWIIIEDLSRETTGEYPNIRIVARKEDVSEIVVTKTAIIIKGKL